MRVGIVTPRYPPNHAGGGEVSAKLLADQLYTSTAVEEVVVYSFDGEATERVDEVPVRRLGEAPSLAELSNPYAYPKLRRRLPEFDVVHAYNMALHPAVGLVSSRHDVPSVATLNSYRFFSKRTIGLEASGLERAYELLALPTTGRALRWAMQRIDAFVALSEAIGDIYARNGFGNCRIEFIPNMIDPSFDVPDVGTACDADPGQEILYVGELAEIKGVEYLIRAMARLPDSFRLRIAGTGNREAALRRLADSLDVSDRVTFEGWVPYEDIPKRYARADVFVHPGIWPEPLNRTVFEAMQASLPVVCTDIGGPPEVIPDDDLLCPPGDEEALARTIKLASNDASEIGARNREHVVANYAPEAVLPRLLALYDDLRGQT